MQAGGPYQATAVDGNTSVTLNGTLDFCPSCVTAWLANCSGAGLVAVTGPAACGFTTVSSVLAPTLTIGGNGSTIVINTSAMTGGSIVCTLRLTVPSDSLVSTTTLTIL